MTYVKRHYRKFKARFSHLYFSIINKIRNNGKHKIKLVGIAKNEAAYIPDWVFHHLYFEFDAIEIYVNNTTDNTYNIVDKLSSIKQFTAIDGDAFFQQKKHSPQVSVYLHALQLAKRQGYSHVVFMDIDEFWTPLDFETSIHKHIDKHRFDVMAFEWVHKVDDEEPFAKPFNQSWLGVRSPQIKIALNTKLYVTAMNAHNIINTSANFVLANGYPFTQQCPRFSTVHKSELLKPLKPAFIMHRSNRSQLEYIAGLIRGNPVQDRNKKSIVFKDNRSGYLGREQSNLVTFPNSAFKQYDEKRNTFLDKYSLHAELDTAVKFIELQKQKVIELIESADSKEQQVLQKILKNIKLQEVKDAYLRYTLARFS